MDPGPMNSLLSSFFTELEKDGGAKIISNGINIYTDLQVEQNGEIIIYYLLFIVYYDAYFSNILHSIYLCIL